MFDRLLTRSPSDLRICHVRRVLLQERGDRAPVRLLTKCASDYRVESTTGRGTAQALSGLQLRKAVSFCTQCSFQRKTRGQTRISVPFEVLLELRRQGRTRRMRRYERLMRQPSVGMLISHDSPFNTGVKH